MGVRSLASIIGALCALAGCAQPVTQATAQPDPVPVDGVGYVIFNAPINASSRDLLLADIEKFRGKGATEIRIGMNSPGGEIDAAQGIVDYMNRMHERNGVTFKAYNLGLVASAATYVFLNAQERYSAPASAFLFHAAGAVSTGLVTAQNLRESADKLDVYERILRAVMARRTRLSDAETLTYVRRTVVLNADDARRDGIVDAIGIFSVPKGARGWVIATRPIARATTRPGPSEAGQTSGGM